MQLAIDHQPSITVSRSLARKIGWRERIRIAAVFWACILGVSSCSAGGGAENVFLVVNPESQDSLTVANHYISLRNVPSANILYLPYKGSRKYISVADFRKKILLPIIEEINERKLAGQVDYVVYSSSFPWRVSLKGDFPKEKFGLGSAPYASLTGATYLWGFTKEKRKEIVGYNNNLYFLEKSSAMLTSRAFRSQYRWAGGGRRGRQGLSYMISSMLGVTDDRGNSVEEVVRCLQKSKQADHTKPSGTIYLMKHNGPRSISRHELFKDTATALRRMGVEAKVVEGKFPVGKRNIAGVTCGVARINMKTSGCQFLPGAFCDNLTSYGAVLTVPKKLIDTKTGKRKVLQVSVCDFVESGATGACGTIFEPTNAWPKFPQATIHLHYARGCSMGESFYQSVSGPYQQLLVGDPLCQPWAEKIEVQVPSIGQGTVLRGEAEMDVSVTLVDWQKVGYLDLYVDGSRLQRVRAGNKFKLDTTTLDDGYHSLCVVATEDSPLEMQGRWTGEVKVKNGRDAVQLSVDKSSLKKGMRFLSVKVTSTNGKPVAVMHNGREVGRVEERSGTTQIPVEKLGRGPIVVYGRTDGESGIRSQALQVELP